MSSADSAYDVGSLGEEAAKFLGAMAGWAREHSGDAGEGMSGHAAQAAAAAHDLDAHLTTGSAECTLCPLCSAIHAVRRLSPEVTGHLANAATSLAQAAVAFLATAEPAPEASPDVEDIDLDGEWPEGRTPTE